MASGGQAVRIQVQARNFWCEGDILVPTPGGYKGRVIDLLNGNSEFLALTEVELHREGDVTPEEPTLYEVVILRKGEIEFVIPLD